MGLKRIAIGLVALAAVTGGLSACGDDSSDPVALTVKASSSGEKLSFDMPKEIDGGVVDLTLDNTDSQPHELGLIQVTPGTKPQQVVDQLLDTDGAPIPDFVLSVGGVGFAAPDQKVTATQDLPEGSYVYFCTFGDDDAVHYKNGMLGAVDITNEKGGGDLPDATESIAAKDYGFDFDGLAAGTHKLKFENNGKQLHHAQLFPIAEGATFDEAKAFLSTEGEPEGPPPIDFENGVGTTVLAGGDQQVVDVTLKKGDYIVVCFMNDKEGGPPHFLPPNNMVGEVTVD